jgi:hypothetical protein
LDIRGHFDSDLFCSTGEHLFFSQTMPNNHEVMNEEGVGYPPVPVTPNQEIMPSQASIPASQPRDVPVLVAESPEKSRKFLGIPASWCSAKEFSDLHEKLDDSQALGACVEEMLGSPSKFPPLAVTTSADEAAAGAAEDAITNKEKLLRLAIDSGTFDMTGVIGKAWSQNKKSSPGLAQEYVALGKSYNAQREFRLKWCKIELAKIVTVKTEIEETVQTEYSHGEYLPFDVIVDREGGEHRMNSVKAALQYVMCCQRFFRQNHKAGNKHFCEYNEMTQRWEFLFLRKGFREDFTKLWRLESKASNPDEAEPAASSSGDGLVVELDDAPEAAAGAAAPTPKKEAKPAVVVPTPKAAGKGNKRKAEQGPESPEQQAKKAQKKEMDLGFRKFAALRTRMAQSSSTAADINGYINRDRKWSWAKGDASDDLKKACC